MSQSSDRIQVEVSAFLYVENGIHAIGMSMPV